MVVTGNDRWGEVICYQYGAAADDAGVLHWVAVCCSVLQCVAVHCSALQSAASMHDDTMCCSVLQCVAVCCRHV